MEAAAEAEAGEWTRAVRTEQGLVRGRMLPLPQSAPNSPPRRFAAFRGLPYARPPCDHLRFQEPEPPECWEGVRDAGVDAAPCCQRDKIFRQPFRGQEDCLYLNVYTPQLPREGETKEAGLPVMVWIHGGAFENGSGEMAMYDPQHLVAAGVVVVALNYRLGVLGFASVGLAGEAWGSGENAGLKDQALALRWVRSNVAAFGGDAGNVTLFGESAGAASVHFHLLAPASRGLFHKAIMQSGCALNPWAWANQPRELARGLARELGCPVESSDDVARCLRGAPARALVDAYNRIRKPHMGIRRRRFGPVVETQTAAPGKSVFLPCDAKTMMENGDFAAVPCIVGMTSQEGIISLKVNGILADPSLLGDLDARLDPLVPLDVGDDVSAQRALKEKMKEFYFGSDRTGQTPMEQYVDLASDVHFTRGLVRTAELLASKAGPVFLYHFAFSGRLNAFKNWAQAHAFAGAAHLDEVGYLFGSEYFRVPEVPEGSAEARVRARMVRLWTNFARTGNPTPEDDPENDLVWPEFTTDKKRYLDINETCTVKENIFQERMDFWKNL